MLNFTLPYKLERDGQIEFFDNYGIPYEEDDYILVDNTDGVYYGIIFEFKLSIDNINKTLFQAIKYLSRMRLKGKSVPATIWLIDLNATTVYEYKSIDYFDDIHKVYQGAASRNNDGFIAEEPINTYNYNNEVDSAKVRKFLKEVKNRPKYIPINIDEDCIVGWAERYYRENPKAKKGDFLGDEVGTAVNVIGEIRKPRYFKGLINPYNGKTNEKFKFLMDKLNDRLSKKDFGAFYTPPAYAKKAAELVQMAVDRVPDGNDYIILDRCAGTGNLEETLVGLKDKNGEELISHCVVSTYEYYEYKVLQERIGDMVREIIPPSEANVMYENGKVANADAMSEEYINNPIIKQYIDNSNCSVILFENPPFRDPSAANKKKEINSNTQKTYVYRKMCEIKDKFQNSNIATCRDLTNQFIWSGFTYYMRYPTDSYILFSPVKWWKSCGIVNCKKEKGYIFNRKYFHASIGAISCIWWTNEKSDEKEIILESVGDTKRMEKEEDLIIKKCYETFSFYYNKDISGTKDGIFCESDGYESNRKGCSGDSVFNRDIVGYLTPKGFTLDANNNNLVRTTHYNNRGTYMMKSNYINLCPLFVAKEYPKEKYYEKGEVCIYFTTSDKGDAFEKDKNFIKACLIYTCLSNQNKCISFDGSDGRRYQNELCFDDSNQANLPIALKDLRVMELDKDEEELLSIWDKIIKNARETKKYNCEFNYGVYQITKELNTFKEIDTGKKKKKKLYDYPKLNSHLDTLRVKLKEYYKSHITKKMFKYELLK